MKKIIILLLSVMCVFSLLTVATFAEGEGHNLEATTMETEYGLSYTISEDFANLKSVVTVVTDKNIVRIEDNNGGNVTFEKVDNGVKFTAEVAGTYKLYVEDNTAEEIIITKKDTVITPEATENSNFDIQNLKVENEDVLIDMLVSHLKGDEDINVILFEGDESKIKTEIDSTGKVDIHVVVDVYDIDYEWLNDDDLELIKKNAKTVDDLYIGGVGIDLYVVAESGTETYTWKVENLTQPITVTIPVKMEEINKLNKTGKDMVLYFMNFHQWPDSIDVPVIKGTNDVSFKSDKFSAYFLMGNLVNKTKPVTPSYVVPKTGVE